VSPIMSLNWNSMSIPSVLNKSSNCGGIIPLSCSVRTSSLYSVGTSLEQLALVGRVVKCASYLSP
jgi:hypothetical protein